VAAVLGEEERLARRVLSGVAASLCLLLVASDGIDENVFFVALSFI
jgi:hypothetical protein